MKTAEQEHDHSHCFDQEQTRVKQPYPDAWDNRAYSKFEESPAPWQFIRILKLIPDQCGACKMYQMFYRVNRGRKVYSSFIDQKNIDKNWRLSGSDLFIHGQNIGEPGAICG